MIRINQIKLAPNHTDQQLYDAIKKSLRLKNEEVFEYKIIKKSIDARHKPDIVCIYSVNVKVSGESKIIKRVNNNNIMLTQKAKYHFPYSIPTGISEKNRPVIVGFGPAGMFAALFMAKAGLAPIVIERGQCVEDRIKTVEQFWQNGVLNTQSNVQFGEGGAGTFSDGKLNTMIKDPTCRIKKVLETLVEAGADSSILYMNKPHIGTDVLTDVVKNMREQVIQLGGEIRFNTRLDDITIQDGCVSSIDVTDITSDSKSTIPCTNVVLAIGHSARDTFEMLTKRQLHMIAKSFAIGLRIEHPQNFINYNAYGNAIYDLPVADYKLTHQTANGRGVYSFCMCPGGYVVNASSEEKRLAINGMSYSKRDSLNANSALIVTVTPDDYGNAPMAGVEFQRKLESAAYQSAHGKIPIQLSADFQNNRISTGIGKVIPCIKGEYEFANLRTILPEYVSQTIIEGMNNFDRYMKGYNMEDAVFSGVESRTSSPLRMIRDDNGEASIRGIYPCGEGAGYAGGITSAAVDGMKTAENICKKYTENV